MSAQNESVRFVQSRNVRFHGWTRAPWRRRLTGRGHEQLRVTLLEFLDTDVFNLSPENCISFLDPLIESWDVDLTTFGMEIVLNGRIASGDPKRYEFVERDLTNQKSSRGSKNFLMIVPSAGRPPRKKWSF